MEPIVETITFPVTEVHCIMGRLNQYVHYNKIDRDIYVDLTECCPVALAAKDAGYRGVKVERISLRIDEDEDNIRVWYSHEYDIPTIIRKFDFDRTMEPFQYTGVRYLG